MIPKKNLYHKFTIEKIIPINVILSDADLSKMQTLAKHDNYITVQDYIISLIDSSYECINANHIVKVKNKSIEYDKSIHDLKMHKLDNPKLHRYKNNIKDNKQVTLEKYF